MRRATRRTVIFMATASLLALACTAPGARPHKGISGLWREFAQLSPKRALALAGHPDLAWVGAAVGGFASQIEASDAALAECRRKRRERRMQAPCLLYAVGSEIVWQD